MRGSGEGCRGRQMTLVDEETEISSRWRVGVHTSIAGSLAQAAEKAHQIGCTAFQIFSTSPRMWKARPLEAEEISAMERLRRQHDLNPLVIHTNYLLNLASLDPVLRQRSIEAFRDEIGRARALRAEYLVLHPGSYRGGTVEQGIQNLAQSIREAMRATPPDGVRLLIENTCCQGNMLGGSFAQIAEILALLDGLPVDCCLDTAHCFAAGMDVATAEGLETTLAEADATIGLRRIKVIHTNDSRSPLGSHRDWHEHIGKGGIGREGFRRIVNHPLLREKVFILETPIDKPGDDRRNIRVIRSLREPAKPSRRVNAERMLGTKAEASVESKMLRAPLPNRKQGAKPKPVWETSQQGDTQMRRAAGAR
jgi:deoxyribonuclease IV